MVWAEALESLGVEGSTTRFRMVMIQSCCNSSTAVALFLESLEKQRLRKSMPSGLSWSGVGSCGGLPWAMLYMIAHSLSRFAHGRRPVAISRMTQPRDHTSTAPKCPGFSPLMTSGDMYIGVPVMDLLGFVAERSCISVRPWRAITLAAPKSTYLMMPLWSRSTSAKSIRFDSRAELRMHKLTFWFDVTMGDLDLMKVSKAFEKL